MSDKEYTREAETNIESNSLSEMTGMMVVDKPKNFRQSFKKLLKYSRSHFVLILIAIGLTAISMVLTLLGPGIMLKLSDIIMNGMFSGINFADITTLGFTLVAIYSSSFILSYSEGYIMASVTQRTTKKMRTDLMQKINRLPMWFYNKNTTGDILSRITNDADTVGQSLNNSVGMLVASIVLLLGSLIMMLITNLIMALTAICATVIGLILTTIIMSKSQKYFTKQQKYLGKINGHIEETFSGHTIVKAYNGEKEMREKFVRLDAHLKRSTFKAQALSGLMTPIMLFIDNLGYVAVCVVGAVLVVSNQVSFGIIIAFIFYVRYFTQPLTMIAQATQGLQAATAASERVFNFLESEEMADESNKTVKLQDVKGHVEFKDISFGYEDTDKTIINNFSASVMPGQKVAIVGPTGAGKTTLVNLLMRFNEINSGEILVDGKSIHDMKKSDVREMFCMVLQDTWIFEGTIKENIIYSKENVSDEDVIRACRAVGLHHFVKTLQKGYNTVLDDKVNLSEGQKQQITIARAMVENAPMLILDEATSNVDTRTELHIQSATDLLMKGRTTFVIAHRLSTIKNADIILVLKDGDIIESGNHESLLLKKGFYAELYNSQFETA